MIPILISFEKRSVPRGWSLAECPACGQFEAARVSEVRRALVLWGLPIDLSVAGVVADCDFCGGAVEVPDADVPLSSWVREDGFDRLAELFGVEPADVVHDEASVDRLRSLLQVANERSRVREISVVKGALAGLVLGVLLGLVAGWIALGFGVRFGPSRNAPVFVSMMAGGAGGLIVGGVLHAVFGRAPVARRLVEQTVRAYRLDLERLADVAREVGGRAERAVERLRAEADAEWRRN